jgi:Zn finger protein HypA/HybF involved in hydrogenase expression
MIDWKEKYSEFVTKSGGVKPSTPKCVKKDIFILRSAEVHENKYTYEKVVYDLAKTNVTITCPTHGDFLQTPDNHLSSKRGCPVCANTGRAQKQRKPLETFLSEAISVHGITYDYSKVAYRNIDTKIQIICKTHGEFLQSPYQHVKMKQGCPICANAKSSIRQRSCIEDFIHKAREVHGYRYSYQNSDYITAKTHITITCAEHGNFVQTPDNHLQGKGCPQCANKNFQFLYLIRYEGIGLKVGITNNLNTRHMRLQSVSPVPLTPVKSWETTHAKKIESLVLSRFKRILGVSKLFDGSTEIVDATEDDLISFIEEQLKC